MNDSSFLKTMMQFLRIDSDRIPNDAEVDWRFLGQPDSWRLFLFIFVVIVGSGIVFYLYRRENDACPKRIKLILAGLRIAVVVLLAFIWLEPAVTYTRIRERDSTIVLLRDTSQSMNTADNYFDDDAASNTSRAVGLTVEELREAKPSRVTLLNDLAKNQYGTFVNLLRRRGDVLVADFSENVNKRAVLPKLAKNESTTTPVGLTDTVDLTTEGTASRGVIDSGLLGPDIKATGRGTDLYLAINQMLSNDPLSAIVIFTDGRHTGSDDPFKAALEAKEKGIPIFIVGVGDPSRPKNIKVHKPYVNPTAWQNDEIEIKAVISAEGLDARDVRAQLRERPLTDGVAAEKGKPIGAPITVSFPAGDFRQEISFKHTPKVPGEFIYSVEVEPLDDERLTEDNAQDSVKVTVENEEKIRVLLVAGSPSWDYMMVERLLLREATIDVSCWLQTLSPDRPQAGDIPISEFPSTQQDLLQYDVILLFDPNPDEFSQEWITMLKEDYCERHSGGVLYMAGPQNSDRFLRGKRTGGLRNVLPVQFGSRSAADVEALMSSHPSSWPLHIPAESVDHPIMNLSGDNESAIERWAQMPGVFWTYPSDQARPTAKVLLEHSDPSLWREGTRRPLIVTGRYGAAHTVYMGFSGTWRWRSAGLGGEYFDTFWIRAVRYLYDSRKNAGKRRGHVQAEKDRYEISEQIRIYAQLKDTQFEDLKSSEVKAMLVTEGDQPGGDRRPLTLLPMPDQPGRYSATFRAEKTGVHNIVIELDKEGSLDGSTSDTVETAFTVELPSVETNQVSLDRDNLKSIAEASGGMYFEIGELDLLASEIPDGTDSLTVPGKPLRLWDSWFALLLLGGLLTCEWGLRKWYKLL